MLQYFSKVIDKLFFTLKKITSYIEYLIRRIFNNYKNRSRRNVRWSQTGTRSVLQSVSFLKNIDMLCINLIKMTAYIEYLIHRIYNNKSK